MNVRILVCFLFLTAFLSLPTRPAFWGCRHKSFSEVCTLFDEGPASHNSVHEVTHTSNEQIAQHVSLEILAGEVDVGGDIVSMRSAVRQDNESH